jgi:outer membrane murein-binding lipoprotein Lpp
MTRMKTLMPATVAVALLGLAGCATNGDVEALRSEIAGVRATADAADQKATAALAESQKASASADQAAEEARMAGEKADRIFRSGLRK